MVGVNPEVGHEQMSGLNFAHGIAQALWHGKLFHIDLNGQRGIKFDQDLVFGHGDLRQRLLPRRPARVRRPGRRPGLRRAAALRLQAVAHRGQGRRVGLGRRQHDARTCCSRSAPPQFRADPEVIAALAASRVGELSEPTLAPGEDYAGLLADRSAFEDFDPRRRARAATASWRCTSSPSSTCCARGDRAGRRDRLLDPVLQGRDPRRRHRGAGPRGRGRRTRTAPRSTRRPGSTRSAGRWPGPAAWPASPAVAVAGQQHGMVCLDEHGQVVRPALLWNDTRSAGAAAELVAELGGGDLAAGARAWADAVGSVPLASFTVTKLRWLAEHEPGAMARTAAVCLPHDWLTWQLAGRAWRPRRRCAPTGATPAAPVTGRRRPAPTAATCWSRACGRRPAAAAGARAGRAAAGQRWRRAARPRRGRQRRRRAGRRRRARRRGGLDRHLRHRVRRRARSPRPTRPASSPASPTPPGGSCRWSARSTRRAC